MKYSIRVRCTNCGGERVIEIEQGTLIRDTRCPVCGNLTLEKPALAEGFVKEEK